MRNFRRVTRVQAASLAVFFLLIFTGAAAAADDWAAPARSLGKKIAEKLKPGQSVALSLQNLTLLSADDAAEVRSAIEAELRSEGMHLKTNGKRAAAANEEGVAEIHVTLAENSQGLLWVAEIELGANREVVMQTAPRAAKMKNPASPPAMFLQSQMLLAQETPILDFALVEVPTGSANRLLVLEQKQIALFAMDEGHWKLVQEAAVLPLDTAQRDLHGRFRITNDSVGVFLPGEICRGALRDTLALKCEITARARQPWDEKEAEIWHPSSTIREGRADSSYSLAKFEVKGKEFEIDAGKDGLARLYKSDDPKSPLAVFSEWGSELAGLKSGCGSGWQILVTRAGDYTERDAVQAFEIADKKAVPASPPLEFAGPVVAMRASAAQDAAFAVVKNMETGQYEAHVVSLSCGH